VVDLALSRGMFMRSKVRGRLRLSDAVFPNLTRGAAIFVLAVARIGGETAPLLFTALNNQFFSTNLNAPISSLPVVIFQFALSPYADWQGLAWIGALIITFAVLALLTGSRKTS
jgi:ABC-type phosphate transport system permease subunit